LTGQLFQLTGQLVNPQPERFIFRLQVFTDAIDGCYGRLGASIVNLVFRFFIDGKQRTDFGLKF
jgi:hypothetical protein